MFLTSTKKGDYVPLRVLDSPTSTTLSVQRKNPGRLLFIHALVTLVIASCAGSIGFLVGRNEISSASDPASLLRRYYLLHSRHRD